ncbi:MAG TPA: class I SAM-dependent methyltransferase [Vicinamibacteria bacterium]|nr:class I SAM-dependent methyltransferase [Vicinamibacteria bacterium]
MLDPAGYWVAPSQAPLSYPAEGNEHCFALEDGSFWFRHRNAVLADMLRLFPPDGPMFDIGGGNGYVAKGLEAEGFPCVLVEPGPQGAANGVKRGLKNVVCATVEGANFRPGSIGAAGLFDVVEHIEDDVAFLRSLHSLMRPGGRLYLTVPAFQMLWSSEDDYAGHHRRYSTRTLTGSLSKAGFEVEYISYFFWFLTLPVFLLRTLPSFLGLRKQKPAENHAREHSAGSGLVSRVVDGLLDFERGRMRQKKRMPLGGSCIAVARRVALP